MNTLRDSFECLSNDELMLKELERRDGIYSFIFHELESSKCTKGQVTVYEQSARPDLGHNNEDNSKTKEQQQQQQQRQNQLVVPFSSSSSIITNVNDFQSIVISTESVLSTANFHDYLKPWNPPPSLVYDHPQLYAFMANCGFRVRTATPRFSHITAPLVRNRRHALKNCPEYKRSSVSLPQTPPDLRKLFPNDPDVHAPFGGDGGGSGMQKKSTVCAFAD